MNIRGESFRKAKNYQRNLLLKDEVQTYKHQPIKSTASTFWKGLQFKGFISLRCANISQRLLQPEVNLKLKIRVILTLLYRHKLYSSAFLYWSLKHSALALACKHMVLLFLEQALTDFACHVHMNIFYLQLTGRHSV